MNRHHLTRMAASCMTWAALTIPGMSQAQNKCEGDLTDFDAVYCYQKIFVQADKDLNSVYGKLMAALPGTAKNTLRTLQRTWIKNRDERSVIDRDGFKYVSIGRATDMTVARVNELNDRLRECSSSGCRVALLR